MGTETTASISLSTSSIPDKKKILQKRRKILIVVIIILFMSFATFLALYFVFIRSQYPRIKNEEWSDSEDGENTTDAKESQDSNGDASEIGFGDSNANDLFSNESEDHNSNVIEEGTESKFGDSIDSSGNDDLYSNEYIYSDFKGEDSKIKSKDQILDGKTNKRNSTGSIQNGFFTTLESQPLSASLPIFSGSSISKYRKCTYLYDDLYNAASIIVNGVILSHVGEVNYYSTDSLPEEPENNRYIDTQFESEDSFTNMDYSKARDKADVVKSTSNHTFVAYGDTFIIWDTKSGSIVSITKMQSQLESVQTSYAESRAFSKQMLRNCDESDLTMPLMIRFQATCDDKCAADVMKRANITDDAYTHLASANTILLNRVSPIELTSLRNETSNVTSIECDSEVNVTVNVGDSSLKGEILGSSKATKRDVSIKGFLLHDKYLTVILAHRTIQRDEKSKSSIIQNVDSSTSLVLFDISSFPSDGGALTRLATKNVQGTYKSAYVISGIPHVVTLSTITKYNHLTRHFNRQQMRYTGLNDDEYVKAATAHATNITIPSFVDRLMNELAPDNNCEGHVQMTVFETVKNSTANVTLPHINGIISTLGHITAFNVLDKEDNMLGITSSTNIFLPSFKGTNLYLSGRVLLITTRGYRHSANDRGSWRQHTYIMSFLLGSDGRHVDVGHYFGLVTGHLLSQHSLDVWDGHLRVVSRSNFELACSFQDDGSGCMWQQQVISDTVYITVLEIPVNEKRKGMSHVGFMSTDTNEGMRAGTVVFLDRRAYLSLADSSWYLVDMSDHSAPVIEQKIESQAISSIHPFRDGKFLLIVGQDRNPVKRSQLNISILNTTDFRNPVTMSNFTTKYASKSQVEYNVKASYFLPYSETLVVPTSIRDKERSHGFDGYVVFDISQESLFYSFNISHVDSSMKDTFCWKDNYMDPRVLVHGNTVTTIKGHTVMSHDLHTKEKIWGLNLDINNTDCG